MPAALVPKEITTGINLTGVEIVRNSFGEAAQNWRQRKSEPGAIATGLFHSLRNKLRLETHSPHRSPF